MPYLLKTPKFQTALLLFLIFLTALIHQASLSLLFRFLAGVGLAIVVDILLLKIRKIKPFLPSAGIVSACIIGLLLTPNLPFIVSLSAMLFAIVSKHFLRIDKKHIFNTAAFGLFFASFIFGYGVSWWGVSWQQLKIQNPESIIFFLILLLPGYVSCVKMRRFKIVASFLLIYNLYYLIFARTITLFDPTVLFFSLV